MERPPWLVLALALLAPSGVIVAMVRVFRRYVVGQAERVRQLEKKIDPERSTSGLEKNGTALHD
jgi:hypothetical protein